MLWRTVVSDLHTYTCMCLLVHADIYIYIYIYYVLVCSAIIRFLTCSFSPLVPPHSVNTIASGIAQLTLNSVARCQRDAIQLVSISRIRIKR